MIDTIGGLGSLMNRPDMQALKQRKGPDFDTIDKNGDGTLDKSELLQLTTQIAKTTGTGVDNEKVFGILDTDKNGAVSKDEFHVGMGKAKHMMGLGKSGKKSGDFSDLLLNMLNEEEDQNDLTKYLNTGVASTELLNNALMANYTQSAQNSFDFSNPIDLMA